MHAGVLLLTALALAGCGGGGDASSSARADPRAMTLRLADLPKGFRVGDDGACGDMSHMEGASSRAAAVLEATRPRGCSVEFDRVWRGETGPGTVWSAAVLFRDADGARKALGIRFDLVRQLFGVDARPAEDVDGPGDDAAVFDSNGQNQAGAGVTWRAESMLAWVYEEGVGGEAGHEEALRLAELQQRRIDSGGSPPAEENDRKVGLDDPAVAVPVYWLGSRFEPEGGLPALELYEGINLAGGGPGNEVKIDYAHERGGLHLDLWTPAVWERFKEAGEDGLGLTLRAAHRGAGRRRAGRDLRRIRTGERGVSDDRARSLACSCLPRRPRRDREHALLLHVRGPADHRSVELESRDGGRRPRSQTAEMSG